MLRLHRLLLTLALFAILTVSVTAQVAHHVRVAAIEGRVSEPSGAPVVSARVELREGDVMLASALTDTGGRFLLSTPADWADGWTIRAERLGYGSVEVEVAPNLPEVHIELVPAPIPLAGFAVEGEMDICSAPEDRDARALWTRAAALSLPGLDTLGIASYTRFRVDTVGATGGGPPGITGAEDGQRASAPLLRLNWDRRVSREGYAFPVRRMDAGRSYESWSYPPLEADFAPHFLSGTFGRLHSFHTDVSDGSGWVVRFCGRSTNRPHLDGVLEIGADTLLHRVEWHFRTDEPDEGAGGWARFPPPAGDGAPQVILPTESVTWRSLPGGDLVRRAQWYEGWHLVAGDSVPLLPQRTATGDAAGAPLN